MREAVLIKSKDCSVKLLACDDGVIKVSFPDALYTLADRDIHYIADRAFLVLTAIEGTRINFMLPLKLSEERIARDFLDYWGVDRLSELKDSNHNKRLVVDFFRFSETWCPE